MATFAFEVSNKPNRMRKYPINFRITQNHKHKRIKTSIAISKRSDFNPRAKQSKQGLQMAGSKISWPIQSLRPQKDRWGNFLLKRMTRSYLLSLNKAAPKPE